MAIEKGQYFTPEKKQELINEVKSEINSLNNELKNNTLTEDGGNVVRSVRDELQKILNGLFEKKGVVTPQETDKILDVLDDSKRKRLQKDFYSGMKKTTIYIIAFSAIIIGGYYYMKTRQK